MAENKNILGIKEGDVVEYGADYNRTIGKVMSLWKSENGCMVEPCRKPWVNYTYDATTWEGVKLIRRA